LETLILAEQVRNGQEEAVRGIRRDADHVVQLRIMLANHRMTEHWKL
jgi:hypothetical protein